MIEKRYFRKEAQVIEYVRGELPAGWGIVLPEDEFSCWDMKITGPQGVCAVCEIKSRDYPLSYFERTGSILIDYSKYERLSIEAALDDADAVVYTLTSDMHLFASRLAFAYFDTMHCPRNSWTKGVHIEKRVAFLPVRHSRLLR